MKTKVAVLIVGLIIIPSSAWAIGQTDVSSIGNALQGLIQLLTGKLARLLAILAVIGIGYMTLCGRLSIRYALYVCLGIGIIFGAPSIVALLGASA